VLGALSISLKDTPWLNNARRCALGSFAAMRNGIPLLKKQDESLKPRYSRLRVGSQGQRAPVERRGRGQEEDTRGAAASGFASGNSGKGGR
jgi:hypothetical protein